MTDFARKVVLVTGATSGIGRAAALMLARRGAMVVAASRRVDLGASLEAEAKGLPGTLRFHAADVAVEADVDALFAAVVAEHGRLDGAINNAGIESEHVPVPDTPVETFDRLFAVNVRGTWLCLRHEMRLMREQGAGAIVNTASIAGLNGFPGASVYTASKHAIIGMTKAAGLELPQAGVRVNCLCPGATRSEMSARWSDRMPGGEAALAQHIPIRRLAEPEEQAEAALFLLSDAASYVTAAVLVADGGSSAI